MAPERFDLARDGHPSPLTEISPVAALVSRARHPWLHGTPHLPELIDIQAVSRSLGISMRQVRRFIADGQIPFVRVGNLIRFDPQDLNEWIDARRSQSPKRSAADPPTSGGQGRPQVGEADP